ncbi:DUF1553 domain-containing protein [bacterium]|nr:MAG: DUF1553 domain-containing protein [bacterium]RIK60457.1 MAG: hypothetical protein DCC64_14765 [Planctomycetota bacterium]
MRSSLALLACAVACLLVSLRVPAEADEQHAPSVNQLVDAALRKVWEAEGVKPAELSSDAEFLRRVYLDTTGAPPTRAEAKAFLEDTDPVKRERLIDALVGDPRFGRYLADYWTAAIRGRGAGQLNSSDLFAAWFAGRVNAGAGFHEIWREIVTAKGNLADAPAISVYFNESEPRDLRDVSGHLSKVLTGVQIQCAQCHKHPYENIEVADFNGMTSFFVGATARVNNDVRPARVTLTESDENVRRIKEAIRKRDSLPKEQQALVDVYAQFIRPRTLDGRAPASPDPGRWRGELAQWLVGEGNRQTPRYIVNRIFALAFGRGLHEPVDDYNSYTSPSHPELLEELTDWFVAQGWSVRRLYAGLLKSRAWQLSSVAADRKAQPRHFASYPVRHLGPEQFIAVIVALADAGDLAQTVHAAKRKVFADARKAAAEHAKQKQEGRLPEGERRYSYDLESLAKYEKWIESMPDDWLLRRTAAARYARLASDDEMAESESFTSSIDQALAVMNGEFTNRISLVSEKSLLGRIFKEYRSPEDRIRELYRSVLVREPQAAELQRALDFVDSAGATQRNFEDLMFALLMTTEFATNH